METIIIPIECRPENIPAYQSELAAGGDLKADINEPVTLPAHGTVTIDSGVSVAIPEGYEGQVRSRSGLNFKKDIFVPTGTIDADYRGHIGVHLYNFSNEDYLIQPGERIAQLVIAPVVRAKFELAIIGSDTERGTKGFGSTGK